MSVLIELTQGKIAVVDEIDGDLASVKWCAWSARRQTFSTVRNPRTVDGIRSAPVRMHSVIAERMGIIGAPDHKNRDGLDNRRENLRQATTGQQAANRGRQTNNTSGYKGVCWSKSCRKWVTHVKVNGRMRHLGLFGDPAEAAKAYDRAAIAAFGEFAVLNFPEITL